ncbi:MAG TPA: hypothetical protein PKE04_14220 [Clostridia bacterium]|nr:hypothetical protein [Clostridia bacterium]
MRPINTVLGTVDVNNLGGVLMHEHVFCSRFAKDYSGLDRNALARRGEILFTEARKNGISTVVDCTPWDLQRDIPLMQEVSRLSGIQIIACAGTYHFYHPEVDRLDADGIAGRIIDAFDRGFGNTGVRPGAIKCAVQDEMSPYHKKLMIATAKAHVATGLPVITHSGQKTALEQQNILLSEGVHPQKLIIGHVGDYHDLPLQIKLLSRGTFVGMDRTFHAEQRIRLLAELCRQNYAGQLMLGHDRAVYMDFQEPDLSPEEVWNRQNHTDTPEGRRVFLFIHDVILPGARENGVTEEQIRTILQDNPRRFFSDKP